MNGEVESNDKQDTENLPQKKEDNAEKQADLTEQQLAYAKVMAFYYWGNCGVL